MFCICFTFTKSFSIEFDSCFSILSGYNFPSPSLVDITGDGKRDLIVGCYKTLKSEEVVGKVCVYPNVGTYSEAVFDSSIFLKSGDIEIDHYVNSCYSSGLSAQIMEINKDGYPDMLVGDSEGNIFYYKGNGSLSFDSGETLYLEDGTVIYYKGSVKMNIASGDWNSDGLPDLIISPTKKEKIKYPFYYYENVGTIRKPLFKKPQQIKTLLGNIVEDIKGSAALGDVDGDGLKDLITTSCYGDLTYYRNVGTLEQPELSEAEIITVWGNKIGDLFINKYKNNLLDCQNLYNDGKCWIYSGYSSFCNINVVDYNLDGRDDILLGYGGLGLNGIISDLGMKYYKNFICVLLAPSPETTNNKTQNTLDDVSMLKIDNDGVVKLENLRKNESVSVKLYNLKGICLFDHCIKNVMQNSLILNIAKSEKLSSGTYLLKIKYGSKTFNKLWVKK